MDSVRFAERRNLVSARVPSHFKRSLPPGLAFKNSTVSFYYPDKHNIWTLFVNSFTLQHVSAVLFGHHEAETQINIRKNMLWKRPFIQKFLRSAHRAYFMFLFAWVSERTARSSNTSLTDWLPQPRGRVFTARSGWVRKISPPSGFDPQPAASCYTDFATPAHISANEIWKMKSFRTELTK